MRRPCARVADRKSCRSKILLRGEERNGKDARGVVGKRCAAIVRLREVAWVRARKRDAANRDAGAGIIAECNQFVVTLLPDTDLAKRKHLREQADCRGCVR